MAIHIGIGFSNEMDAAAAAQEAVSQAKQQLGEERVDFAFLFNSIHYDPKDFLPAIFEALDHTKIIGSSCAGLILSGRIETRGMMLVAIRSDTIFFETGHVGHLQLQDAREAGNILAKNSITDFGKQHRRLFFFLADGLLNNFSDFINGIRDVLGNTFLITGAGSSDDFQYQKTFQYHQNLSMTHGAAAALLGGRLNVGVSCRHGWRPLGKPRVVDQSEGHIIKTINGQKAVSLYKEYFDQESESLKTAVLSQIHVRYPLGLHAKHQREYLLRNVINILDDGSIVCQDHIPAGSEIHIMIGNKDSCLKATEHAILEVSEQLEGRTPNLIIVVESLLRYKLLGRAALQEIELIKRAFGDSVPLIGIYSAGEIFSVVGAEDVTHTQLQNGSILLLAISGQ